MLGIRAYRQQILASNIANADTPGYRPREVDAFSAILNSVPAQLATTSPGHMQSANGAGSWGHSISRNSWDSSHSGNDVSIEGELMAAASTSRMASLDTNVTRSFHRMLLSSTKV